ncbi:Uma2 family endonuclease [Desulfonema magnum]|uniref:DUF820 n=1 Tax=Desulfonema magnum TaxID=45655 RepID=A0A975BWA0_9BACT|nr:Uma2 family endonuclease [Desulfonema magnum]QTA92828.1 DUF820 [Desulfonema magnum]
MSALQHAAVYEDDISGHSEQTGIEAALKRLEELDLPTEDGIPLETNWHRIQMNLLIDLVHQLWRDRQNYFVGGNMFIYFSVQQVRNRDYRGPDFFVVKDTDGTRKRDAWVLWEEGGQYPDVIVELASASTIKTDLGLKKNLYERIFRTREYFCYDPDEDRLYGWKLTPSGYVELTPDDRGRLRSKELSVWLGTWEGEHQRLDTLWLRFYTDEGQLLPTSTEAETQRAEAAEAELKRLREMLAKQGLTDDGK